MTFSPWGQMPDEDVRLVPRYAPRFSFAADRPPHPSGGGPASPAETPPAGEAPSIPQASQARGPFPDESREPESGKGFSFMTPTPPLRGDPPHSFDKLRMRGEGGALHLSDASAFVLRLIAEHDGVDLDEAMARAICAYAEQIGMPALARGELADVPEIARAAPTRSGLRPLAGGQGP